MVFFLFACKKIKKHVVKKNRGSFSKSAFYYEFTYVSSSMYFIKVKAFL